MTKVIPMGKNGRAIVLGGGKMHKIQVDGKVYEFEMHPFCGPTLLNKHGSPLKHQPTRFLYAASQWAKQGRKNENGLCVWYHEPEMIVENVTKRMGIFKGYKPAVRGT